jgi:hypothetical protein
VHVVYRKNPFSEACILSLSLRGRRGLIDYLPRQSEATEYRSERRVDLTARDLISDLIEEHGMTLEATEAHSAMKDAQWHRIIEVIGWTYLHGNLARICQRRSGGVWFP